MNYKNIILLSFIYFSTTFSADDAIGIANEGNTCFMNGVLQCLYHTENLTKFLNNIRLNHPHFYKFQSVAAEYLNFLKLYQDSLTKNQAASAIAWCQKIWSLEENDKKRFPSAAQGDSNEFLQITLGHLGLDATISDINRDQITNWLAYPLQNLPQNTLTNIMGTIIKSYTDNALRSITYEISPTIETIESFNELGQPDTFATNLQTAIKDYYNAGTKKRVFKFPEYLPIAMKRFTEDKQKILHNIPFPLELDLAEYLDEHAPTQNSLYELYGIVIHGGTFSGGHYTSLVKINNTWYFCNDSSVNIYYDKDNNITAKDKVESLSTSTTDENPTPYVLFYKQKTFTDPIYHQIDVAAAEKKIEKAITAIPNQINSEIESLKSIIQNNTNALNNNAENLKKYPNADKRYKASTRYEYYVEQNKAYQLAISKLEEVLKTNDFNDWLNQYLNKYNITKEDIRKSIEIQLIDENYLISEIGNFIGETNKDQARNELFAQSNITLNISDAIIALQELNNSLVALSSRAELLAK